VLLDIRVVEAAGLHGAVSEVAVHHLALPVQVPLQQGRTSATVKDDLWRKCATESERVRQKQEWGWCKSEAKKKLRKEVQVRRAKETCETGIG
jgi:hypothetical protein